MAIGYISCQNCTAKQIDLTNIFVTTTALLCKHVIINKCMYISVCTLQMPTVNWRFYGRESMLLKRLKLIMLYKLLFIVHVITVKGVLKSYIVV